MLTPYEKKQILTLNETLSKEIQIDGIHFPELAEKDKVQSVPTLILEDRFRWSGTFQIKEIVAVMAKRDPAALGAVSLEMMLKEGKASQLAEMILEKAEIFPVKTKTLIFSPGSVCVRIFFLSAVRRLSFFQPAVFGLEPFSLFQRVTSFPPWLRPRSSFSRWKLWLFSFWFFS